MSFQFLLDYNKSTFNSDFLSSNYIKQYKKFKLSPLKDLMVIEKSSLALFFLKRLLKMGELLITELKLSDLPEEMQIFYKNAINFINLESELLPFISYISGLESGYSLFCYSFKRIIFFVISLSDIMKLIELKGNNYKELNEINREFLIFVLYILKKYNKYLHLLEHNELILMKKLKKIIKNIFKKNKKYRTNFLETIPFRKSKSKDKNQLFNSSDNDFELGNENFKNKIEIGLKNNWMLKQTIMPLSYIEKLEQGLDFSEELNEKRDNFNVLLKNNKTDNQDRRTRTLTKISMKIHKKSFHSKEAIQNKKKDSIFFTENGIITKKDNILSNKTTNFPKFIQYPNSKNGVFESNKLSEIDPESIINSVNYDEVANDYTTCHKLDIQIEALYPAKLIRPKARAAESFSNTSYTDLMRFQEKHGRKEFPDIEIDNKPHYNIESIDSSKDILNFQRNSLVNLSPIKRGSKKFPSKIIKDSYEQKKEIEKKNENILNTFKEKKKKLHQKNQKNLNKLFENTSILINGVAFQEPEQIINKNQDLSLSPENIKDTDDEVIKTDSSTSSDDENRNAVLEERKRFITKIFSTSGGSSRLTLKRHSKILSATIELKSEKAKKSDEKRNLFQNWHLIDDIEVLNHVSAFYVKNFRESVNFFIITYLIKTKLRTRERAIKLKLIRERWNKIKFAFQMFILYRRLHNNQVISFFEETQFIVTEMRKISLLNEFDHFLYVMEKNANVEEPFLTHESKSVAQKAASLFRTRSKTININDVTNEAPVSKMLVLERGFTKFNPRKYINGLDEYQVFEAKTIELKFLAKIKPDMLIL